MTRASRGERGSASLLAVTMTGVLGVTALLVAVLGGVLADQRRVESAADLAALSGAVALQDGRDACDAAARTAARNRASVERCSVDGDVVTLTVRRPTRAVVGRRLALRAQARAGPVGLQREGGGGVS